MSIFTHNEGGEYDSHQGIVLLVDPETAVPIAVMDASEITAIRTAAVTGVATRLLAREDASVLAILGSGVQARTHLEAMLLARQIREAVPSAILIFVLPPSVDIMMDRLTRRGTEDARSIARRLRSAVAELQAVPEFDYVVVNDDLDACIDDIRGIVELGSTPAAPRQDVESIRAGGLYQRLVSVELSRQAVGLGERD